MRTDLPISDINPSWPSTAFDKHCGQDYTALCIHIYYRSQLPGPEEKERKGKKEGKRKNFLSRSPGVWMVHKRRSPFLRQLSQELVLTPGRHPFGASASPPQGTLGFLAGGLGSPANRQHPLTF